MRQKVRGRPKGNPGKTSFLALLACAVLPCSLFAQTFLLGASPALSYPLAPSGIYSLEAGASVDLLVAPASDAKIEAVARFGYGGLILDQGLGLVSVAKLEGGLALPFLGSGIFSLGPVILAGGYGAFRAGYEALFNPMISLGIRADFHLGNSRLSIEPCADLLLAGKNGEAGAFYASAGVRLSIAFAQAGASHRPLLRIQDPDLDPLFPTIYKYYSSHQIGMVTIVNGEWQTITNMEVTIFVPSYMDGPQTIATVAAIKSGKHLELPVMALLKNSVLGITETDTAQARVHVKYVLGKDACAVEWDGTIRIEGRNAIVWDDDRKAAAFVTARDPTILKLARNTVAGMPSLPLALPFANFRSAAILFQALEAYGLRYVVDPKGSYATMKGKTESVDYLQYPVETLTYRTGDCDDLTTLYLAMLESVGIETAFITVPGHIYAAFALDAGLAAAKGSFSDLDKLIFMGDKVWVPIETTSLGKGFAEAWAAGAREWREAERQKAAALVPVHEAWQVYEPSFISSTEKADVVSKFPDPAKVAAGYSTAMKDLSGRELADLVALVTGGKAVSRLSPQAKNQLGTVYARYGQMDKAEPLFRDAAASGYDPALCNLGNVLFIRKDWSGAADYYGRALSRMPDNAAAALGKARALFEAGRYADAAASYAKAALLSPDRAAGYAYIASGTPPTSGRAADPAARLAVDWSDQ